MSVIADMIRAGIDPDIIARVAEEIAEARLIGAASSTASRSANAERQARFRARKKDAESVTNNVTSVTCNENNACNVTSVTVENSPKVSPQEIYNQPPFLTPSSSLRSDYKREEIQGKNQDRKAKKQASVDPEILKTLESCLTPEKAQELLAHRKAKKSPLSALSARLLVSAFNEFGNPSAAVDEMILRDWKSFRADWMRDSQPRAGPELKPAGRNALADAFLMRKPNERNHKPQNGIIDVTPTREGSGPACWPSGNGG